MRDRDRIAAAAVRLFLIAAVLIGLGAVASVAAGKRTTLKGYSPNLLHCLIGHWEGTGIVLPSLPSTGGGGATMHFSRESNLFDYYNLDLKNMQPVTSGSLEIKFAGHIEGEVAEVKHTHQLWGTANSFATVQEILFGTPLGPPMTLEHATGSDVSDVQWNQYRCTRTSLSLSGGGKSATWYFKRS
jgi:hypothetical protein